jgi:hypothetical protein
MVEICVGTDRSAIDAATLMGRLYGPKAKNHFMSHKQSTFSWRLQIIIGQVSK